MESQFFLLYLRKLIQKNTMEKKLAIKGHRTRGKEVIELLEMMGGVNVDSHKGHFPDEWKSSYYIYGDNTIQFARDEFLLKLNFVIFTLEEFLEKFPFKVGDLIKIPDYESEVRICDMRWNGYEIEYMVHECVEEDDNAKWYTAEELSKWNAEFLVDNEKNGEVQRMVRGITINHLLENALNKDLKRNLAIKGHLTRNKEVIELLKMMGGKSMMPIGAIVNRCVYTTIEGVILEIPNYNVNFYDFTIFTLEEFLEKYPYKVGDKVCLYDNITEGCVTGMKWDKDKGTVKYCVYTSAEYWCDVEELSKWNATDLVERHDEEQCEEMNETQIKRDTEKSEFMIKHMLLPDKVDDNLEYNIINGYEFDRVENDKIILKPIKPKYPTNYQECCDALGLPMQNALEYINQECHKDYYYNDLQSTLNTFVSLKICRDAYWKIAGEQMGLGKLWKPEYSSLEDNTYFTIQTFYGEIDKSATSHRNTILVFPTVEMRDAFYENFKDLIKQCKELL